MKRKTNFTRLPILFFVSAIFMLGSLPTLAGHHKEKSEKVYELRTYYTHDGKLDALKSRFKDHTHNIFNRLNMKVIAYWTPTQSPEADNTLIYIIEHDSEADAKKKWQTFIKDPAWKKAYKASKVNGPLVDKIDVVFMQTTDFSPSL